MAESKAGKGRNRGVSISGFVNAALDGVPKKSAYLISALPTKKATHNQVIDTPNGGVLITLTDLDLL